MQWQTDTSAEAAQRRIIEQLTTATSEMVMLGNGVDKSEASPRAKTPKETPGKLKSLKKSSSKKSETDNEAKDPESPKEEEPSPREKLLNDFKQCLKKGMTPAQLAAHLQSKGEPKSEAMDAFLLLYLKVAAKGFIRRSPKRRPIWKQLCRIKLHRRIYCPQSRRFAKIFPPTQVRRLHFY